MAEVDRELLLSVTGGLGGLVEDDHGKPVYCKDEDCLGEPDHGTQAEQHVGGRGYPQRSLLADGFGKPSWATPH